jgi:hypothetical protein
MENYQKVHARFEEEGCTLLTSFEELEELRKTVLHHSYQFVRVRFIGTCTHESNVVYTNFNLRKTGKVCKACMTAIVKKDLKKKNKNSNEIEYEGIKIIEECLKPYYEVIRTKEGCLADLAIRKKGEKEDLWIPVQMKTTMKNSHGMYSFNVSNTYNNMLLICICISEKKIWIMPYNGLTLKSKLNISVKSKYSKYLVDNTIINTFIDTCVSDIVYNILDTLLIPVNPAQQREQEYVKKRETCIPFLSYQYPDVQNTCVDVIVNGKKVQEKVLGFIESKKGLYCSFSANSSKVDGKRQFRMYQLGENDYYWLHSSIDDRFWIIPELVLYDKGFISNKNEIKNRKTLWFKSDVNVNQPWLNDYEYRYTNLNKDEILKTFG